MLTAGTIPPELLHLANDIVKDISTARTHIENHNYGLADGWLEEALSKLPFDTNEGGYAWPELEDRTKA